MSLMLPGFCTDDLKGPYDGVAKALKLEPSKEMIPPSLLDDPESLSLATLQIFVEQAKFDARYKPAYDAKKGDTKNYTYFTSPITSNKDRCFYLYTSHRLGAGLLDLVTSGTVDIFYLGYQKTESSAILKYQLISTVDIDDNGEQKKTFPYEFTIEYVQKKLVQDLTPQEQEKRSLLRRQRTLTHIRLGTTYTPKKFGSGDESNSNASSSSDGTLAKNKGGTENKKKNHKRERSSSVV